MPMSRSSVGRSPPSYQRPRSIDVASPARAPSGASAYSGRRSEKKAGFAAPVTTASK